MKKFLLIILTIIFSVNINLKSEIQIFNNLTSLKSFGIKYPEYPEIDNKNLLKPDYSSFHKKITPSNLQIFIAKIKKTLPIFF